MGADRNLYQLSLLNIVASGVRIIARGYPRDLYRSQKMVGLTESELSQFIEDFRPFGRT